MIAAAGTSGFGSGTLGPGRTGLENLCIQPEWWQGLSTKQQTQLAERYYRKSPAINQNCLPTCLVDDCLGIGPWSVISRRWIGSQMGSGEPTG